MGTWHALYLFDEKKFTNEIIPAFKDGMRTRADLLEKYVNEFCWKKETVLTFELIATIAKDLDSTFRNHKDADMQGDHIEIGNRLEWLYDMKNFFEFVIFHECAYPKPEYPASKYGISALFRGTEYNSVSSDILEALNTRSIFNAHGMGIVNWITNEDVKLLIMDFDNIAYGEQWEHERPYDLLDLLKLADSYGFGLVQGADIGNYEQLQRKLSK